MMFHVAYFVEQCILAPLFPCKFLVRIEYRSSEGYFPIVSFPANWRVPPLSAAILGVSLSARAKMS